VSRLRCELCTGVSFINGVSRNKLDAGSERCSDGPLWTRGVSLIKLLSGVDSDSVRCRPRALCRVFGLRRRAGVSIKEIDGSGGSFLLFLKLLRALFASCSSSELSFRADSWRKNNNFASNSASLMAYKSISTSLNKGAIQSKKTNHIYGRKEAAVLNVLYTPR
jgi:hypothetical protein